MEFLLILSWTVTTYLSVLVLMMLVRVIYPLFFSLEESRFFSFVYATTEPFLMPVRGALSRIEFFASSAVDFTYIVTVMLIMIVQLILPSTY